MTQNERNRAVAHATGETVSEVSYRGFVPLTDMSVEREPLWIDWDEHDEQVAAGVGRRRDLSRVPR